MKLTKTHREDFVNSVIADVPQIDYIGRINDLIQKEVKDHLKKLGLSEIPLERLVHKSTSVTYYELFDEKGLLLTEEPKDTTRYYVRWLCSVSSNGLTSEEIKQIVKSKPVTILVQASLDQSAKIKQLRDRVTTLLAGCNTLKQAQEALPEFIKYLPKPVEAPTRNLPAVGNVVAELAKAGWPKKSKK